MQKPDGHILSEASLDSKKIQSVLIENIKKYARYQNFLHISNDSKDLKAELVMTRYKHLDENFLPHDEKTVLETKGGHRLLQIDDYITLTVKNISPSEKVKNTSSLKKSFYFYIFSLGTDGSVSLIYPPEGTQDNLLPLGAAITTYPMKISPPEGLNTLKVIATSIPTEMQILIQEGYKAGMQEINNPLAQLIDSAWNGRKSAGTDKIGTAKWATDQLSFFIEK